jgi:hypothetical protein
MFPRARAERGVVAFAAMERVPDTVVFDGVHFILMMIAPQGMTMAL